MKCQGNALQKLATPILRSRTDWEEGLDMLRLVSISGEEMSMVYLKPTGRFLLEELERYQ
jgi:hypothetical protein